MNDIPKRILVCHCRWYLCIAMADTNEWRSVTCHSRIYCKCNRPKAMCVLDRVWLTIKCILRIGIFLYFTYLKCE